MPPKGKKGKGNKAEDAELLRLQQEQERKAQEERLLQEKLLKEKQLRDAIEAQMKHEFPRLQDENNRFLDHRSLIINQWLKYDFDRFTISNWEKYLNCEQFPDIRSEKSVNSFLTLWKDSLISDYRKISVWSDKLKDAEIVCELLEAGAMPNGRRKENELARYASNAKSTLRHIICLGWDMITSQILTHNDFFPQEQEENQIIQIQTLGNYCVIWNNTTKNPRFKKIEFAGQLLFSSIPRPISQANVSVRLLFSSQSSIKSLYFDQEKGSFPPILGGVLELKIFELPVIPKKWKGWSVRPYYAEGIPRLTYPLPDTATESTVDEDDIAQQSWPFSIEYRLPDQCAIPAKECCEVQKWDAKKQTWDRNGIEGFDLDIECNTVRLKLNADGAVALIQKPYAQYPLKKWAIEKNAEELHISLDGQFSKITIAIKENICKLLSAEPEVPKGLYDLECEPSIFFQKLSFCGRDFIGPTETPGIREEDVSDCFAFVVANLCDRLGFSSHERNKNAKTSQCIFNVKRAENPEGWKTVLYDMNFSAGSISSSLTFYYENDDSTNEVQFNPGTISKAHASLLGFLSENFNEKFRETGPNSSALSKAIYETLFIVRPCT